MKILLYAVVLSTVMFASTQQKADVASCKKCHPIIVEEFQTSMHKRSSIYDDKVHKAIWDRHPAKKKGDYKCAKCHTPTKTDENSHEGITCLSCHTIMDVEKHEMANKNIYTKEPKTFYSAEIGRENEKVVYKTTTSWWGNKTTVGSAYHDIDYTNRNYYNGNVCMGCHSHKKNAHKFDVCITDDAGAKNVKSNCITCHMPKVGGSATTVRISDKHAFHGFAGARVKHEMLSKYVNLELKKTSDGFEVIIDNQAPHNLMTHPLRVVQLRASIIIGNEYSPLKPYTFVRVIGRDKKPSMPWVATEVVKDNMIKAKEKRVVKFKSKLQSGDKVEVTLGYFVVNPKVIKKLNLEDDKELKEFKVLKTKYFTIK